MGSGIINNSFVAANNGSTTNKYVGAISVSVANLIPATTLVRVGGLAGYKYGYGYTGDITNDYRTINSRVLSGITVTTGTSCSAVVRTGKLFGEYNVGLSSTVSTTVNSSISSRGAYGALAYNCPNVAIENTYYSSEAIYTNVSDTMYLTDSQGIFASYANANLDSTMAKSYSEMESELSSTSGGVYYYDESNFWDFVGTWELNSGVNNGLPTLKTSA